MALEVAPTGGPIVSTGTPSRAQYAGASLIGAAMVALTLFTIVDVNRTLGFAPWFVTTFGAVITLGGIATAYLVSRQAIMYRSVALAAIVAAYIHMSGAVFVQTLVFQGVFNNGILFGASPDSASWLYFFWHIGFTMWIAVYLMFAPLDQRIHALPIAGALVSLIQVAGVAIMVLCVSLALWPSGVLPPLYTLTDYFNPLRVEMLLVTASLGGIVFTGAVVRARRGTILDVWLPIALLGLTLDSVMSVTGAVRYSSGWYLGRVEAMIGALALLVAVFHQYGRTFTEVQELSDSLRAAAEFRVMAESIPQIVFTLHRRGRLEYISRKWFELTGQTPEDAHKPDAWVPSLHPDDLEEVTSRLQTSMETGEPFAVDGRIRLIDRTYRWFNVRGIASRDRDGDIVKWYGTLTDIQQQKDAEERARALFDAQRRQAEVLEELYAREHRVAETLQRAFLPRFLPSVPGFVFDSVYRPNTEEANVGGDWYDAFELPDGTIAVSLGDVGGHGLDAAVTMGRVRETFRAAATVETERPDRVLARANRTMLLSDPGVLVTALFGVIDPVTLHFAYATAGHPPPVLARGGAVIALEGGGIPLGYDLTTHSPLRELFLEPSDFLAIYTDGLIESTRDVLAGETRLNDALANEAKRAVHSSAEAIVNAVLGGDPRDDVALLTIALEGGNPGDLRLRLPAQPHAATALRAELSKFLHAHDIDDETIFNVLLVAGEAVNNAIEHARSESVELRAMQFAGRMLVEVRDFGVWLGRPEPSPQASGLDERGRGLFLMRELCAHHAIIREGEGTRVRFGFGVRRADCKDSSPAHAVPLPAG